MALHKIRLDGIDLVVISDDDADASPAKDAPHTSYVMRRTDVHRDTAAFKNVIASLDVDSVIELFGGSGWHSALIQRDLRPKLHIALDCDQSCVDTITRNLPGVRAYRADSFAYARDKLGVKVEYDWVHADFNQFTLQRHRNDKKYAGVLDGIFRGATKYVTLTDSALFGVYRFPKNMNSYKQVFERELSSWEDYYKYSSEYYHEHWGFSITQVYIWGFQAAICLIEPTPCSDFEIITQVDKLDYEYISEM